MSTNPDTQATSFEQLGLPESLLVTLSHLGYETPSPIQAATIPDLLQGHDLLGQAQTGTGKTAAFALPVLANLDLKQKQPQILVLAPTRELAIQVAEAFQSYARQLKGFHVLPIYGGTSYEGQLRSLKRGVHVVVGTPGRVMDHIRRKTLRLDQLKTLVLDEADEMLRMGFIDDVKWTLEHIPEERQMALFSATMPAVIKRIANEYLRNPKEVRIAAKTSTATTVRQRYWPVSSGVHKLEALTRILEMQDFEAMLIFVRTKAMTEELAEKLTARGYSCEAINGDITQKTRERTIEKLKKDKLDILVATDVAARGLDVERISHVINYDIPYDNESYVHRIGRTGRAGRKGEAILFVANREKHLLRSIEKTTRQKMELMELPSAGDINQQRITRFKERISDTISNEDLSLFLQIVEDYQQEHDTDPVQIAAALARLAQGTVPLLLKDLPKKERHRKGDPHADDHRRRSRKDRERSRDFDDKPARERKSSRRDNDVDWVTYRLSVGKKDNVKAGNIVGAIANEAGLDSQYINNIEIHEDFATVELPDGMPSECFNALKKTWICGSKLGIKRLKAEEKPQREPRRSGGKRPGSRSKPTKKKRAKKSS